MSSSIYSEAIQTIKTYAQNKPKKSESFRNFLAKQDPDKRLTFDPKFIKPFVFDFSPMIDMDFGLKMGETAHFEDRFRRRGIVIGTTDGKPARNVIVYQNYAGHEDAISCCAPSIIHAMLGKNIQGWLSYDTLEVLVGLNGRRNIGATIETLLAINTPSN